MTEGSWVRLKGGKRLAQVVVMREERGAIAGVRLDRQLGGRSLHPQSALEEVDADTAATAYHGEAVRSAKLNGDKVRAIRALKGTMTARALGAIYGVSAQTISSIHERKRWRHVK
jgi:hypothetical protein